MKKLTMKDIQNLLDSSYNVALNGIPGMRSVEELAKDYLNKTPELETAIKKLIFWQINKCTTTGFLTGLGGIITMPVAIPADIGIPIYVQVRMVAAIAYMREYDIKDDRVKSLVYICLCGNGAKEILSETGIKFGQKITMTLIEKIPTEILTKINQKVGFRLITKFGETGIVNLGKCVPVIGGIIGGGIDLSSTKIIAKVANQTFT